jgi:hypothetical protein
MAREQLVRHDEAGVPIADLSRIAPAPGGKTPLRHAERRTLNIVGFAAEVVERRQSLSKPNIISPFFTPSNWI